ncbi:HAMP domain-containing sensor histidine kinase [Pararhodobacter sp. CCB-MM2]|uniref:sensor histidine kinase n=1 Tax=Pararhodobacter sp. CCB-MM2 TaxID=1786003 RepID=UPI00083496BB|nr:HAMP domain-containing sensor histidine kinase [Pararhodobacter sp. CCB-MM2]
MSAPISWSMRFALALSAVFAIGALSAGGLSYVFLSHEMAQRLAADTRASAESLGRIAAAGDRTDLIEQIDAHVVSNTDHASLYAFFDAQTGERLGSLMVSAPFEGARRLIMGEDLPSMPEHADMADAYQAYGVRTDLGWVIAARDEAWVAESGEILIQTTAWALAFALALSVALAFVVARRNERRIAAMEAVLDRVGAGRLDERIADHGRDDLARLGLRIDRMLGRLEAGVAAITQVSTDVAHDLRAPLSRLRIRLEPLALDADLPEQARHEAGSALEEIDAISGIFDAILRLSRLQSGSVELRRDVVDLTRLAQDVVELLSPVAEDAGHRLTLIAPPSSMSLIGDADLLMQAVVNLVDNALRHCPAPAEITVAIGGTEGQARITVSDNGPGIPAPERQRVLERFVRLDTSRSVVGSGLGLSLVAAIAERHGMELALEDNAPGLRVSLVQSA